MIWLPERKKLKTDCHENNCTNTQSCIVGQWVSYGGGLLKSAKSKELLEVEEVLLAVVSLETRVGERVGSLLLRKGEAEPRVEEATE